MCVSGAGVCARECVRVCEYVGSCVRASACSAQVRRCACVCMYVSVTDFILAQRLEQAGRRGLLSFRFLLSSNSVEASSISTTHTRLFDMSMMSLVGMRCTGSVSSSLRVVLSRSRIRTRSSRVQTVGSQSCDISLKRLVHTV